MSIKKSVSPVCPFFNEKQISDSSKKLYISKLKKLNEGVVPTDFKFLKKKEDIMEQLEKQPLNTRRSSVIAIVSAVKGQDPELHAFFTKVMDTLNKETQEATKGKKSERQEENWVSLPELEAILETNKKLISSLSKKKKVTEQQYDDLLSHLVLSLYTKMPPRRSMDYLEMHVAEPDEDRTKNYYNKEHFYFNNYKTAKTYKQQVTKPPKEIVELLKLYMKFKPKENSKLLLNSDGNPLTSLSLRMLLNKATGKKISTQMLRNIYSTDKISPMVEKMEETAEAMGSSVATLVAVYSKNSK